MYSKTIRADFNHYPSRKDIKDAKRMELIEAAEAGTLKLSSLKIRCPLCKLKVSMVKIKKHCETIHNIT